MSADGFSRTSFLDIETVASPDVEGLLDPVRAPANYKDPFKIAVYRADKLAEKIATASLEPDLCEVVAVGVDSGQGVEAMTRADLDETQILEWFWDRVAGSRFIGFNILKFDMPVLIRRSQLLGIPYPHVNLDRYRTQHVDLLEQLSFNGLIPYRSLGFYCRRFGIDVPEDVVAGSDIGGLVAAGEWDLVLAHVVSDVAKTRLLAERLHAWVPVKVNARSA